jgi:hypothetical protein
MFYRLHADVLAAAGLSYDHLVHIMGLVGTKILGDADHSCLLYGFFVAACCCTTAYDDLLHITGLVGSFGQGQIDADGSFV